MDTLKGHNFAEYFKNYIDLVTEEDVTLALKNSYKTIKSAIKNLSEEQGDYAYADGKWTIKELLIHIMDAERIFCERALRFARNDKTNLPGFDHDDYVNYSGASERSLKSVLKEYKAIRKTTILLFKNFTKDMMMKSGTANNNEVTVLSLGYIIAGHETHHLNVLKEKYLNN